MTSRLLRLASIVFTLALASSPLAALPAPRAWRAAEFQPILDKTLEIRLAPDLATLPAGERLAVDKLLAAGRVLQNVYELANHRQAREARRLLADLERRRDPDARALAEVHRLFQGPIATTLDNHRWPFLPVDSLVPGKNVYPWGLEQKELDAWLATHPDARANILNPRTVVRRATASSASADLATLRRHRVLGVIHPGLERRLQAIQRRPDPAGFYAVPYPVAYADSLLAVHALLHDAAAAIEPTDVEFAGYLRLRALDLLSNDYEGGDAAWVTGRFGNLNAQIGAYETYDDELYGVKTFHGLSLMRRDAKESEQLTGAISSLQSMENALPYTAHKRVRDGISVGIYDVIADFGQPRGANTATILPNESRHARRYGRTILMRRNILMDSAIFDATRDSWRAAVDARHATDLQPDGSFYRVLWHEIGHYLGPDRDRNGRELDLALEEESGTYEELKADLVSLYSAAALRKSGYYDDRKLRGVYASGVARVLLKSRPRRDQVYQTMQLMQLNWYLEKGSFQYDPASHKLRIRYDRYHEAVASMLKDVLALQHGGDKAAAVRFIERWTTWDTRHEALAKAMRAAEKSRFRQVKFAALGE